jgi:hypothetical protein
MGNGGGRGERGEGRLNKKGLELTLDLPTPRTRPSCWHAGIAQHMDGHASSHSQGGRAGSSFAGHWRWAVRLVTAWPVVPGSGVRGAVKAPRSAA